MEITLILMKDAVLAEVAKTSEYRGAKMTGDEGAYERVRLVDENLDDLARYWDEARVEAVKVLRRNVVSEGVAGNIYSMMLRVPDTFNTALTDSLQLALQSFFIYHILGLWYGLTLREEMEESLLKAASYLDQIKSAIIQRAFLRKMYQNYNDPAPSTTGYATTGSAGGSSGGGTSSGGSSGASSAALVALQSQLATLQAQYNTLNTNYTALQTEHAACATTISGLESQLQEAQSNVTDLSGLVVDLNAVCAELGIVSLT